MKQPTNAQDENADFIKQAKDRLKTEMRDKRKNQDIENYRKSVLQKMD
jgi:hypothetical protein